MKNRIESRALKLSAVGALLMALLGIGFSLAADSDAILLDGFFSLITFIMSLLTMKISRVVLKPDDEKYQFGYAGFEPLLNSLKGLIIVVVSGFAVVGAVDVILDGGQEMALGIAMIYTVIASAGCLAIAFLLRHYAAKSNSSLVVVDAKNWMIDGGISSAVMFAFLGAYLIQDTGLSGIVPYTDSILVIIIVVISLPIPVKIIKENVGELLQIAPPEEMQESVRKSIDKALNDVELNDKKIRMVKVGRYFYILVHILFDEDYPFDRLSMLDDIRIKIIEHIKEVQPSLIADIIFTSDKSYLE